MNNAVINKATTKAMQTTIPMSVFRRWAKITAFSGVILLGINIAYAENPPASTANTANSNSVNNNSVNNNAVNNNSTNNSTTNNSAANPPQPANNINGMIPAAPAVNAESYILMDFHSGQILVEHNADQHRNPASLTKIMTSYVIGQAMKAGKFTGDDLVTIGNDAWATGNPVFKGSSLMFLKPGMRVPVWQLIRGINIQSGNDACVAMADYVAGGQDAFIQLMNNYVQQLALNNTHFKTVYGLDADGQYTSARDMALLAQALIRDVPLEYATYKEKEFTFNGIRQLNRNGLLWDKSLNVDGIKTGHTSSAGYNLVASATEGDMRLISVVMGATSSKGRETASKQLLTWGFRFYDSIHLLQANKAFATEPVWFGNSDHIALGSNQDIWLTIPKGRAKDLKASYQLNNKELQAPLQKNQVVGTINFQLDGKTIDQRPLMALNDVPEGGWFSRLIDYIKLLFHRWFG